MGSYTLAFLTLWVLVVAGCSGHIESDGEARREAPRPVTAQLELLLVAGTLELTRVEYQLQRGMFRRSGVLELPAGRLSFRIGSLPPAAGYRLSLVGVANDGAQCSAERSFEILQEQLTQLELVLSCGQEPRREVDAAGNVRVAVDPALRGRRCPVVTGMSLASIDTAVGTRIALEGFTSSATPTIWSSPGGTFEATTARSTTFYCTVPGTQTIQFETVRSSCPSTTQTAEVECEPLLTCGNERIDLGEECDDGNQDLGDGCSPACLREPFCVADIPCELTHTSAFCVGSSQIQAARTASCSEICDSSLCSGAACIPYGPVVSCPAGQQCVDELIGNFGFSARCRVPPPLPAACQGLVCPANLSACLEASPPPYCAAYCTAQHCCSLEEGAWWISSVDCAPEPDAGI